ncbi:hypothetical protein HRG_005746 [Hirsutella rhossiliensis]|uniref:Uncharacterized protein n=1 Tax=Hirsutella rhossiliensis TaxID=111463 RepID=A0A9P8MZQ2_9HYPO|nr:uncharacterized protein HRG_05746 [Hirsutella rhossiliensis]KAH0963236.1 hypothetical protein HRG_05746 [Hirsutella rhossiliensis]
MIAIPPRLGEAPNEAEHKPDARAELTSTCRVAVIPSPLALPDLDTPPVLHCTSHVRPRSALRTSPAIVSRRPGHFHWLPPPQPPLSRQLTRPSRRAPVSTIDS